MFRPAGSVEAGVLICRWQVNCHSSPGSSSPLPLLSPALLPLAGTGVAAPHMLSFTVTLDSGVLPGLVTRKSEVTAAAGSPGLGLSARSPRTAVGELTLVIETAGA